MSSSPQNINELMKRLLKIRAHIKMDDRFQESTRMRIEIRPQVPGSVLEKEFI